MANTTKDRFLNELTTRFGAFRKLENSQSLFDVADGTLRIYIRYSKSHSDKRTFCGLRAVDLRQLEGVPSVLCLLSDGFDEPLLIPYAEFEEVFRSLVPANDGQFKAQIFVTNEITELYIANAGRFTVESYFGWGSVEALVDSSISKVPSLSHSQVQTLLGAIGSHKGYDVWIPTVDRSKLDWSIASKFKCTEVFPLWSEVVTKVAQEIDVIWLKQGSGHANALFEIEHSTPIYSGLLRFNDVFLTNVRIGATFSIVANNERRLTFVQQLGRPTFRTSGLSEICNFLEYSNVFKWHQRLRMGGNSYETS